MRRAAAATALALALSACGPAAPTPSGLGQDERSWERAFRRGREADWGFAELETLRRQIVEAPPAGRRALCDAAYDLADARTEAAQALSILDACATALAQGAGGDPLAAAVQLEARDAWPAEAMVQSIALLARVDARGRQLAARDPKLQEGPAGIHPQDLVRVLDRATVFHTPAWTALQFLKDMEASLDLIRLDAQADLFEEALGRRGRHVETQAILAAFREAVSGGLPAKDLSAACRRKLRLGMSPARLPGWLGEVAQWPVPPLERPRALRLAAAGLACGLPDEEVAALGPFVARSALDADDAGVLADRLEEGLRRGLKGQPLLEETLAGFSGARPSGPTTR